MSRVAKKPIMVPKGVDVLLSDQVITIKGGKGALAMKIPPTIMVDIADGQIAVANNSIGKSHKGLSGTTRAIIANMVLGASQGFEKKLTLVGVGYRAQVKTGTLSLSLGFSHPIEFQIPTGITIETPSPTEVVVKGYCRQQVGQVAANIRSYRPPEPYKGKGIRYSDEHVVRKEAKKK